MRTQALASGLFAPRGGKVRAWVRPWVLLSSASGVSGESTVAGAACGGPGSVTVGGISPTVRCLRRTDPVHEPPLRRPGDVTRKANRCAVRVARSS
jgi:hypothetical protein